MANLSKSELLERIIEAVDASGWNVFYDPGISRHPFKLRVSKDDDIRRLKIYIWNISHGGGAKRPTNEYRIQVKVPRFEPEQGWQILILGWWEEGNVFAGYDYRKHMGNIGWSASFQIKLEALEKAHTNNSFATSDKGNGEIAIAFKPEFFMEYASHATAFHSFGQSKPDINVLETLASDQRQLASNEIIQQVSQPRQKAIQTIRRALRDYSFKMRVLTAYSHRCGFCDVQLDLIDASHILPVSYETSTDETRNGIALCALHHRAYDSALVTFNEQYRIVVSPEKMQTLKQVGHEGGLDKFRKDLKPLINVPPERRDQPHLVYVTKANKVRGWAFAQK